MSNSAAANQAGVCRCGAVLASGAAEQACPGAGAVAAAGAVAPGGQARPGGAPRSPLNGHRSSRLRFGVAGLLRRSERLVDRMVSAYERIACLDEEDAAEIYLSMGNDLARSGRPADAIQALERTLALQPKNGAAWYQLGLTQLQQGGAEAALHALDQAQQQGIDSFELWCHRADALAELDRRDEAVEALERALEQQPEAAEACYRRGVLLDQLKRYEEATAAFSRAIELAPREVSYHQSLGFSYESMGRRDEAIECFKRALDLERRTR